MSEPRQIQHNMPDVGEGPSVLQHANIGSIEGGNFYSIQGNAVFNRTVHEPVNRISEAKIEKTASMLEQWAAALVDFRRIHGNIVDKRTEGTGESFKTKQEIQDWIDGVNKFLWITGGPGAGKTYLASVMIDEAESIAERLNAVAVVFAYLRYTEKPTSWDVILSLVIQLVLYSHDIPSVVDLVQTILDRFRRRRSKPSFEDLVKLLKDILKLFPEAFIIIDGLDEMLEEVQRAIIKTMTSVNARVLFTSRPLGHLEDRVRRLKGADAVFMHVTAQPEDVDIFIYNSIEENPSLAELLDRCNIREEVVATIKTKAGGMFLHVALQLEMLQGCRTLHSIRQTMTQIPSKIGGLYASTIQRIPDERDATLARLILTWLVYIEGTLSIQDLQYAIAVDTNTHRFEESLIISEKDIISICRGLIVVESPSRQVCLIHYTAKEVLAGVIGEYIQGPHDLIARTCIGRLIDCGFQRSDIATLREAKDAFARNPLLEYAHINARYHVRHGIQTSQSLGVWVEAFVRQCASYPYIPRSFISVVLSVYPDGSTEEFLIPLKPLHVAAHYGLAQLVSRMARVEDVDPNLASGRFTSLAVAAAEGDEAMVDTFLDLPGIDPGAKAGYGGLPVAIVLAVACGHISIANRMLQTGTLDINEVAADGNTLLMMASTSGQEAVVRLLVEVPGININAGDDAGRTALMFAVRFGCEGIVKILLAIPNIDVNAQTNADGLTAVHYAAYFGHGTILNLLFNHPKRSPGSLVTTHGITPLFMALAYQLPSYQTVEIPQDEHDALPIAHLLLEHPEIQNIAHIPGDEGQTPLIVASIVGYPTIVELLLAIPTVDVNATSHDGKTALECAYDNGHTDIVDLLLAAGATQPTPGVTQP